MNGRRRTAVVLSLLGVALLLGAQLVVDSDGTRLLVMLFGFPALCFGGWVLYTKSGERWADAAD